MVKGRAHLGGGSIGWAKARRQKIARCISVGQCDNMSAFGLPDAGMLRGTSRKAAWEGYGNLILDPKGTLQACWSFGGPV